MKHAHSSGSTSGIIDIILTTSDARDSTGSVLRSYGLGEYRIGDFQGYIPIALIGELTNQTRSHVQQVQATSNGY